MHLSKKKYMHKESRGGIRSEILILDTTTDYFQFWDNTARSTSVSSTFLMAQEPLVTHGLLIIDTSRSQSLRHTIGCKTVGDERSTRRTDLYLTTHNTHNRQTSMTPAGFGPAIPASQRSQTHSLDRAAVGINVFAYTQSKLLILLIVICEQDNSLI
jgi:hypothetical protein